MKLKNRKIWPMLQIGNFQIDIHYNVAMKQIQITFGKRFFKGRFFRFKLFL